MTMSSCVNTMNSTHEYLVLEKSTRNPVVGLSMEMSQMRSPYFIVGTVAAQEYTTDEYGKIFSPKGYLQPHPNSNYIRDNSIYIDMTHEEIISSKIIYVHKRQ